MSDPVTEMTKSDVRTARAFKIFAWACLLVGFGMLMLESYLHYRHYLMVRNPPPESQWSAVGIFMGAMLLLFGAGALQFAITQRAVSIIGYILPIFANAMSAFRGRGGERAADTPPAPSIAAAVPEGTDPEIISILEAEHQARLKKHELSPPILEDG